MANASSTKKTVKSDKSRVAFATTILLELFLMLDRARMALSELVVYYNQSAHASSRVTRLDIISLILEGLNFILIPMVYIEALFTGKTVPFTLSNNMKWLYAGALFALSLAAFLVPAVAWPLSLAIGSI